MAPLSDTHPHPEGGKAFPQKPEGGDENDREKGRNGRSSLSPKKRLHTKGALDTRWCLYQTLAPKIL
jgi:hypothetical protein